MVRTHLVSGRLSTLILGMTIAALSASQAHAQSETPSGEAAATTDATEAKPVVRVRTLWHPNGEKFLEGRLVDEQRDGLWSWWYDNGQQFASMEYDHGTPVGHMRQWSPEGSLLAEGEYRDGAEWTGTFVDFDGEMNVTALRTLKEGQPDGVYRWWHETGKVNTEGRFANGNRDGIWRWYYTDGQMFAEVQFENGETTGTERHWAPDGTLLGTGEYRDNKPWNGTFVDFNGRELRLTFQRNFKEGRPHGEWIWWYADGTLNTQGSFVDGNKHGQWTWWYENGQKFAETDYEHGTSRGALRHWSSEGKLLTEGVYALDGREWNGTFVDFTSDLVITAERTLSNGVKDGTWSEWHRNGAKKSEATYVNGRPQGIWSWWDENGFKTSEERFVSAVTSPTSTSTN